ncbi:MAG: SMC-Scp complex subunit ScpB [Nitrososphaeria archaeon]
MNKEEISVLKGRIEAALYASGRPLNLDDLSKATGVYSKRKNLLLAREVQSTYNSFSNALEIVELQGNLFAMQLRSEYNQIARKFATKPLVPEVVLKTLSYIAFYQPITIKDIVHHIGPKAYRHLSILTALEFVTIVSGSKPRTYITTSHFSEYFGLSKDIEVLKQELRARTPKGLQMPKNT